MDDLFGLIFFASIAAFIIGVVRPVWVRLSSRKRVAQVFSALALVSFFGIGVFAEDVTPAEPGDAGVTDNG